ncbi:hypothetical protein STEG23_009190 [Scotinomys teguina]
MGGKDERNTFLVALDGDTVMQARDSRFNAVTEVSVFSATLGIRLVRISEPLEYVASVMTGLHNGSQSVSKDGEEAAAIPVIQRVDESTRSSLGSSSHSCNCEWWQQPWTGYTVSMSFSSCVQRKEDGLVVLEGISGEGNQHMADASDTQILSPCSIVLCRLRCMRTRLNLPLNKEEKCFIVIIIIIVTIIINTTVITVITTIIIIRTITNFEEFCLPYN